VSRPHAPTAGSRCPPEVIMADLESTAEWLGKNKAAGNRRPPMPNMWGKTYEEKLYRAIDEVQEGEKLPFVE